MTDQHVFMHFQVFLINMDKKFPVRVNNKIVRNASHLKNEDILTIVNKKFRIEIPGNPKVIMVIKL